MELLLKRDISSLGRVGEVVTVKSGYARNYLLPMGYAIPVTKANLAEIEAARAEAFAAEQERVADLKKQADALGEASVTIEGRANDEIGERLQIHAWLPPQSSCTLNLRSRAFIRIA